MRLHEYIDHNINLENLSKDYLEELSALKTKSGKTITDVMTGLYIEACETCEYSSDEIKIYRAAQDKFLSLLEEAHIIVQQSQTKQTARNY